MYEVVIIGGGPAGLTAAIYTARAGRKTAVIEKSMPGGQAGLTDWIENYPGFPEGVSGFDLTQSFYNQAQKFGMEYLNEEITAVDFSGDIKKVYAGDKEIQASSVIIASGSEPRLLGVPGESELKGKGVSYCATCDGAFFRDKKVAVVGGGDAAVEEAMFLTKFASQVVLIHRRNSLRAAKVIQDRAFKNERLDFKWNTVVREIQGSNAVENLLLENLETGEKYTEGFQGIFVFVGTVPNTGFLKNAVNTNDAGYIPADSFLATNIEGVFIAGDAREKFYRQVSTAVGDGATAALSVERYLGEK